MIFISVLSSCYNAEKLLPYNICLKKDIKIIDFLIRKVNLIRGYVFHKETNKFVNIIENNLGIENYIFYKV